MKKIKAIILTIWFTLSIPIGVILCYDEDKIVGLILPIKEY